MPQAGCPFYQFRDRFLSSYLFQSFALIFSCPFFRHFSVLLSPSALLSVSLFFSLMIGAKSIHHFSSQGLVIKTKRICHHPSLAKSTKKPSAISWFILFGMKADFIVKFISNAGFFTNYFNSSLSSFAFKSSHISLFYWNWAPFHPSDIITEWEGLPPRQRRAECGTLVTMVTLMRMEGTEVRDQAILMAISMAILMAMWKVILMVISTTMLMTMFMAIHLSISLVI